MVIFIWIAGFVLASPVIYRSQITQEYENNFQNSSETEIAAKCGVKWKMDNLTNELDQEHCDSSVSLEIENSTSDSYGDSRIKIYAAHHCWCGLSKSRERVSNFWN